MPFRDSRRLLVFLEAALAIRPLAPWLGAATEQLAERIGEGVGELPGTRRRTDPGPAAPDFGRHSDGPFPTPGAPTLTLGQTAAGFSAHAKGVSLGIIEPRPE